MKAIVERIVLYRTGITMFLSSKNNFTIFVSVETKVWPYITTGSINPSPISSLYRCRFILYLSLSLDHVLWAICTRLQALRFSCNVLQEGFFADRISLMSRQIEKYSRAEAQLVEQLLLRSRQENLLVKTLIQSRDFFFFIHTTFSDISRVRDTILNQPLYFLKLFFLLLFFFRMFMAFVVARNELQKFYHWNSSLTIVLLSDTDSVSKLMFVDYSFRNLYPLGSSLNCFRSFERMFPGIFLKEIPTSYTKAKKVDEARGERIGYCMSVQDGP